MYRTRTPSQPQASRSSLQITGIKIEFTYIVTVEVDLYEVAYTKGSSYASDFWLYANLVMQ